MATWWEITFTGDPTEDDLEHVAELIREGFTSGQLIERPDECAHCGVLIDQEDAGLWAVSGAERSPADQRRYCANAPDHLHAPA
jgi:hypothetical protein